MKVSQYLCDFNENLKQHDAHVHMIVEDSDGEKRDFDCCAKHALQMVGSTFLNRDVARIITITKIGGASSTKVEVKAATNEGVKYEKSPCPAGCEREFAPQGLRAHLLKFHPNYKPEES